MDDLPGLDLAALQRWLSRERPELLTGPLSGSMIAGGKSNLTYRISDGTTAWALRRPPLGHVLPSAHDMGREYKVISGLAATDVPVAQPIAFCADPDVLGAQFYIMSFVEGAVLDHQADLDALDPATATRAGQLLVEALVALHNVVPTDIGLGDFGRPDGFMARQLTRWHAQWDASETRPVPVLESVVQRLREGLPTSGAPSVVHGDYRLTNVIYGPSISSIAAIVDWEMAAIGDPLADVGLLYVYHSLSSRPGTIMPLMPAERGFLTPDELAARYAQRSGRDTTDLNWYIAFGYFKLAVISEGIAARHLQGKTVGAGFDEFGPMVPGLLQSAYDLLA